MRTAKFRLVCEKDELIKRKQFRDETGRENPRPNRTTLALPGNATGHPAPPPPTKQPPTKQHSGHAVAAVFFLAAALPPSLHSAPMVSSVADLPELPQDPSAPLPAQAEAAHPVLHEDVEPLPTHPGG